MPNHPLAEVFGFPTDNLTPEAEHSRNERLCPFRTENSQTEMKCTKTSTKDPLGVCSVFGRNEAVITCPVRFSQNWRIARDAADFFFPAGTTWEILTEVRLNGRDKKSAGNIDVVLVAHDAQGRILDYGALEVQAVYISGNVRDTFRHYMEDPEGRADMNWRSQPQNPRPDYLTSVRASLMEKIIVKGRILNTWGCKMAIALDKALFDILPRFDVTDKSSADFALLVYGLVHDPAQNRYQLQLQQAVYSRYDSVRRIIMQAEAADEQPFITSLEERLSKSPVARADER